MNDALAQPDMLERLASFGFASGAGPVQQVTDLMRADRTRYADVVNRLNILVACNGTAPLLRGISQISQP